MWKSRHSPVEKCDKENLIESLNEFFNGEQVFFLSRIDHKVAMRLYYAHRSINIISCGG